MWIRPVESVTCLDIPHRRRIGIVVRRVVGGGLVGSHRDMAMIHWTGLGLGQPHVAGPKNRVEALWMSKVPSCSVIGWYEVGHGNAGGGMEHGLLGGLRFRQHSSGPLFPLCHVKRRRCYVDPLSVGQSAVVLHRPVRVLEMSVSWLKRNGPQRLHRFVRNFGETRRTGGRHLNDSVSARRWEHHVRSREAAGHVADRAPHRWFTLAFDRDRVSRQGAR